MLEMHYAPDGRAVSDFEIEREYQKLRSYITSESRHIARYTTENIFLRVRGGVYKKEVPHTSVCFYWQDQEVPMNDDSTFNRLPVGFLDTTESLLFGLLGVKPYPRGTKAVRWKTQVRAGEQKRQRAARAALLLC